MFSGEIDCISNHNRNDSIQIIIFWPSHPALYCKKTTKKTPAIYMQICFFKGFSSVLNILFTTTSTQYADKTRYSCKNYSISGVNY